MMVFGFINIKAANASIFSFDDIAAKVIGKIMAGMGYFLGLIASAVFWLGGLLVDFAFNINLDLLSNENAVIQSGWQIVLSFTNLGFVLGIIVIAFATILRMESYGMKQILWKLVVAALLVNFSFVIAGAFISFSDIISQTFLSKVTLKGPGSFSVVLGKAIGAQTFLDVKSGAGGGLEGALDVVGQSMTTFIVSILFIAAFTFVGGLTLFALAIMLLIRYVVLSILLIISPIIWLLWIFPATQKYWKEWWDNFLRWTFFAPIVLFFLYLAISTLDGMKNFTANNMESDLMASAAGAKVVTFGVDTIGKFVVIIGLMIGGLIAANKLSIAGASTFYGMAQGAGNAVGGWAGRKGKQWGTGWLSKKRGEPGAEKSYADRISAWSAKSKLAKYTVLPGLAARGIAKFSAAGGENLVKDAKGTASKRSLNENLAMLGYADAPNRQGILQHLQEKDLLDKVPDVSKYISKGYKAEAARFGQGVGYNNIEKSLGMNVEMKEAFDKKDTKTFFAEGKKFFSKFSEKDWAKPQYNEIYKDKPGHGASEQLHGARQEVFVASLAEINPGQLAKTMPRIKSTNFDNYEKAVNKIVTEMYETNPEKAKKVAESFKKALGRRMLGIEWESMEPAETTEPKEEKKEEKK